jgi:hypothetical protein
VRAFEAELHPLGAQLLERVGVHEPDMVALEGVLDGHLPVGRDLHLIAVDLRAEGAVDRLEACDDRGREVVAEPHAVRGARDEHQRPAPRDAVPAQSERVDDVGRQVVEPRPARDAVRHALGIVDPPVVLAPQRAVAAAVGAEAREPVRADVRERPQLAVEVLHHDRPPADFRGDIVLMRRHVRGEAGEEPRAGEQRLLLAGVERGVDVRTGGEQRLHNGGVAARVAAPETTPETRGG